jgi:hypothetical protein
MPQKAMWQDGHETLRWDVERLWHLAQGLPVRMVPLEEFADVLGARMWFGPEGITFREFVERVRAVQQVDLSYPIILAAEGWIMDGRTRLQKALLEGRREIPAVRFAKTPDPDERQAG